MTKSASSGKIRAGKKAGRGKPAAGSWASLVAAGGAIVGLLGLLYASCKDSGPEPKPEPAAAVAAPTNVATAAKTVTPPPPTVPAAAPKEQTENWNDSQIAWQSYEDGISRAKSENKPVCLVFFTNWCPHCRNYSRVFSDPRIVAQAKNFVMIRLNADDAPSVSEAHSPDGAYVPRTFFLGPDGKLLADIHAPRPRYVHFYDENNPESLLSGMDAALKKIRAM